MLLDNPLNDPEILEQRCNTMGSILKPSLVFSTNNSNGTEPCGECGLENESKQVYAMSAITMNWEDI